MAVLVVAGTGNGCNSPGFIGDRRDTDVVTEDVACVVLVYYVASIWLGINELFFEELVWDSRIATGLRGR